jgi:hypothetical protein
VPRQNRATPFGALVITPARGTLMGNRGCLHDAAGRIRRSFAGRRWIICRLEFRGRRRTVMAPGRYTELFFLDEATALAAGHRPCAECQRDRYELFRAAWTGLGRAIPSADELDAALHAERLDPTRGKRTYRDDLARLPPGAMVADGQGGAVLVAEGVLLPWTAAGYGRARPRPRDAGVDVLTPPSIVSALRRGYPVGVHASAGLS